MSENMNEQDGVIVEERIVLEKFEGEALPENLIERVHIVNGEIVEVETIKEVD